MNPGIDEWCEVHVPLLDVDGWFVKDRQAGLRELERIVREAHAAMAVVIAAMPESRDKTTEIARTCGVSAREARERRKVAAVCDRISRARELLRNGQLSSEHLASLESVLDKQGVETLLDVALLQTPEDFRATVEQFRLADECGGDTAKRQHAQRSLRFFNGPNGMVGLRGLLPPVEGKAFKEALAALVDLNWRREHPERAEKLGGHGGDDHEQRMADALLALIGIFEPWQADRDRSDVSPDQPLASPPGGSGVARVSAVGFGKPRVVIVFNVDRWKATLIGHGPVPVTASLFDQTRAELYYLFENMVGEIMKFGRARRNPTPLQRLAVIARDQHCVYPDCVVSADRCEIHHFNEVLQDGGPTDADVLGPLCERHHHHVHTNGLVVRRDPCGGVAVRDRVSNEVIVTGQRHLVNV